MAMLPVVLLEALPLWARDNEWFHAILLVPVALVSGPLLAKSAKANPLIGACGVFGFLSLGAALFAPTDWVEIGLTTLGASLIFAAHFFTLRALARAAHS